MILSDWASFIKAEDPQGYKKLAEKGIMVGYPVKIAGQDKRPDNGIGYHSTVKFFNPEKDHVHSIHEVAKNLSLNPPNAKHTVIEPGMFKDRNGNDVYVIKLKGNDADRIKEHNARFSHMGYPATFEYTPHVSVDKATHDKIKASGAKTAHEAGIEFGHAQLKQGHNTVATYRHPVVDHTPVEQHAPIVPIHTEKDNDKLAASEKLAGEGLRKSASNLIPDPSESTHKTLELHHGTKSKEDFDHFDLKHHASGFYPGVYTTTDPEKAKAFGTHRKVGFKGHVFEIKDSKHAEDLQRHFGGGGSGYKVVQGLKAAGYHAIKRGDEHLIFDPKHAEIKKSEDLSKAISSPKHGHTIAQLERLEADNWHNPDTGTELQPEESADHLMQMRQRKADKAVPKMLKKPKSKASNGSPSDWLGKSAVSNYGEYRSALKLADATKRCSKHSAEQGFTLKKSEGAQKVRQVADSYAASKGLKLNHDVGAHNVNTDHAANIANAYSQMKHEPNHPAVKSAYGALVNETKDQFNHLQNNGLKISRIQPGQENPYKNGSKDLIHDVHTNNHMWYYPTESGFGDGGSQGAHQDHPLLQDTGVKHDGKPLLANDMFRIVHDYFGHAKEGHSFGPKGEDNAWKHHMQMYSPEAQKALTSETRGQNSWVNYGPHGESNRKNPANTVFAEQKAGLLPSWTHEIKEAPAPEKKIQKSEEPLQKGSLQSRSKFHPAAALSEKQKDTMSAWQGGPTAERAGNREVLPRMEGGARERALHKLSGQTKTKLVDGKRHFLLHRGMSQEEHAASTKDGIANHPAHHTSWTPKDNIANNFANPYSKAPGKLVSAWVHEDNVHTIPKQFGSVDNEYAAASGNRANRMANEHEVIVKPNHSSSIASERPAEHPTSRKGDRIHDVPTDTNDAINIKGSKETKSRSMNAHPDDIRNIVGHDNRDVMRTRLKSGALGKSEEPLEKGIKSALAGATMAASMATSPSASTPAAANSAYDHHRMLDAISQVESNGGQNTSHAEMKSGAHAYGKYGLTPELVKETIRLNPALRSKYSKALALNGDTVNKFIQDNPGLEDKVADRHLARLEHHFGADPDKISYGWLNGITGTNRAAKEGKNISDHWHVKKVRDALSRQGKI